MAISLLFTVHSHFDCQARAKWWSGAGAFLDCALNFGAAHIFGIWQVTVTFHNRRKGTCFGGLNSTFYGRCADRSCLTSMCRCRGRCCTVDLVVAFCVLSNFVAHAVAHEHETCGSLQNLGGHRVKAALWHLGVAM